MANFSDEEIKKIKKGLAAGMKAGGAEQTVKKPAPKSKPKLSWAAKLKQKVQKLLADKDSLRTKAIEKQAGKSLSQEELKKLRGKKNG